jgi:hypothetical protein
MRKPFKERYKMFSVPRPVPGPPVRFIQHPKIRKLEDMMLGNSIPLEIYYNYNDSFIDEISIDLFSITVEETKPEPFDPANMKTEQEIKDYNDNYDNHEIQFKIFNKSNDIISELLLYGFDFRLENGQRMRSASFFFRQAEAALLEICGATIPDFSQIQLEYAEESLRKDRELFLKRKGNRASSY